MNQCQRPFFRLPIEDLSVPCWRHQYDILILALIVANIIVDMVCRSVPPKSWAGYLLIIILVPDALAILVALKYAPAPAPRKGGRPGESDHPSRDGDLRGIPLAALPLLFPFLPRKTAALQAPVTSPHIFALSEQVSPTIDIRTCKCKCHSSLCRVTFKTRIPCAIKTRMDQKSGQWSRTMRLTLGSRT